MNKLHKLCASVCLTLTTSLMAAPNLIVTTDIGGDPDDIQSMRRLMLYSNDVNILGLVASAAGTPNNSNPPETRADLITAIVTDYGTVRDNLALHAPGYPTSATLLSRVKSGNPNRGTNYVGAGHDTAGSNWIVSQVDAAEGPVNISIWGGATDVAQAFFRIRADRSDSDEAAWVAKVRIYSIGDQDGLNSSTGDKPSTLAWIRTNFPTVWMIEAGSLAIMSSGYTALFRGWYQNDSAGGGSPTIQLVETAVAPLNQTNWLDANVRNSHGALGASYPIVTQNPQTTRNTSGEKGGDAPSWCYFLDNGLSDSTHPTWGCWGGRFSLNSGQFYVDAQDAHWSGTSDVPARRKWTVARWRKGYQNEMAARMDWCVLPYAQANHSPNAVLNGDSTKKVLHAAAAPGSVVNLSAVGSSDPDGDTLTYKWWNYADADTYTGTVAISNSTVASASFTVPMDAAGKSIHIVLEVTDNGAGHPLTSYRRLVVSVSGSAGPVAHWKLDETSGTVAADASGNLLNGTLVNGPVWSSGKLAGALDFDGANDYITLGNPAALRLTGAMTLSAWVKIDTFTNSGRIISKQGASGARGWSLNIESTGTASFQIASNSTTLVMVNSPAINAGVWHLLTGVYEPGSALRLYVNGVLSASNTTAIPASQYNSGLNVEIGRRPSQSQYFDGMIDDVRVYNRALSDSEVATLAQTQLSIAVNDSANASDWSVRGNLQAGDTQYGDRAYAFTNVPSALLGSSWIRTANDSKAYTGATLVSFSVDQTTDVYVAHNDLITSKPAWLTGWVDTGLDLVNNESTGGPKTFSLYKKTYSAGTMVSLGSNGHSSYGMYTVILK